MTGVTGATGATCCCGTGLEEERAREKNCQKRGIMLYLMSARTDADICRGEKKKRKPVRDEIYEDRVNIYPVRFLKCPDLQ
jgi:hypothetical protein